MSKDRKSFSFYNPHNQDSSLFEMQEKSPELKVQSSQSTIFVLEEHHITSHHFEAAHQTRKEPQYHSMDAKKLKEAPFSMRNQDH